MSPFSTAALVPLLLAATQPDDPPDSGDPPWSGQMQCGVTWTDSGDADREWMLSVASDTSNLKLAISDRVRDGDPKPLARNEIRELVPRKAKLEVSGIGSGEVEVTSYPMGEDRMWHDVGLGHVEKLDTLAGNPVLVLTIGKAAPMRIELRDFAGARAYLKHCLDR